MSEELTAEDLAILEGEDVQDDESPEQPAPQESAPVEPEKPVAAEAAPEVPPAEDDLGSLKRANKGLLEELIKTRRAGKEDRDWRQGVQDRLDTMADRLDPQEPLAEPVPEPNKEEDPIGWSVWQSKRHMEEVVQPLKEEMADAKQHQDVADFQQRFVQSTQTAESHFLQNAEITKDGYESNLDDLRFSRAKWHIAAGMSQEQAEQAVQVDEISFIADCLQNGLNPSAEAMKMYEFMKPEHVGIAPTQEVVKEPGVALDKVESVRRGQETDVLGTVPGGGDKSIITFDQLADMPDDDPIAQKILSNPKLFARIQIHGQVTV